MGAIKLITGIVFATIFVIAILNYSFGFANDNNAVINLSSDAEIKSLEDDLQGYVVTIDNDINDTGNTLQKTELEATQEVLSAPAVFLNTFTGMGSVIKTISNTVNTKIFGGASVFQFIIVLFGALLIMYTIAYGWKLFKGNPD